ncbi:MAG: hypothetical protein GXX79_01465 [Actinomycetales bacterium]|nr:hypothetical protein [Actinomycetales bacterium]
MTGPARRVPARGVPARRGVAVAVGTGLALAVSLPAQGYWTDRAASTVTARADTLGVPGVTVEATDALITVRVGEPDTGPAPSSYTVAVGTETLCTLTGPGECPDPVGAPATPRTYRVAAHLGTSWVREATLQAATTPPRPVLTLAEDSDTGVTGDRTTNQAEPRVSLSAAGAASAYAVALRVDGAEEPFATVDVPAGTDATTDVTVPTLDGGSHTITAVASAHGVTSAADPLSLEVVLGAPVIERVVLASGSDPGRAGAGDTVTVTASRPVHPGTVCPDWDPGVPETLERQVTAELRSSPDGADAVLTLRPDACGTPPQALHLGTVTVNRGHLVEAAGPTDVVSFPGSTLRLDADRETLTLVLGTATPESTELLAELAAEARTRPAFTPESPDPTDHAGTGFAAVAVTDAEVSGF